MDNPSHMTLSADNGVITTTLNGIEVNTTTVDPFELGKIGFRAVETSTTDNERFYADNIVIKDENDNVLFFLSVPTDCPQRDERRGFTGDAQIFARTATYNMDVAPFLEKFMQDICGNQTASGAFPHMAPSLDGYNPVAGGWMDAGVIIPWQLYQQYGDKAVLEKHYDNMCRYMDHLVSTSVNYIRNRTLYGDWLNVNESTPNDILDTSFCVYSSDLMVKIAEVLGDESGVAKFTEMANNFRTAWQNKFVKADGTLTTGSQTGYALGLYFNIFKESDRNAAAAALVENIKNKGWHLTTGFCGVSYLAPALSSAGYHDVAYRLLEQETYPSWLLSGAAGSHHHLGTLELLHAGKRLRRRGYELLQPLCIRLRDGMGVPLWSGHWTG